MIKKNNHGATLIETIFYIVLFSMLSTVVIYSIVTMTKSFKEISIQRELMQGGEIMERMSREIKKAYQINSLASPTDLKLNSIDDEGDSKTVEFVLENNNLRLLENDIFIDNLNNENIKVENLSFKQMTTANGKAIKIFLSVSSLNDKSSRSYDFYNTLVLRGDY
jgi:type II secretory pathway pseudopilin PulG